MSAYTIAHRYAKSLVELAQERGQLDAIYGDVIGVKQAISNSRELELLLSNPIVKPEKKRSIVAKIFEGKVSPLTSAFMDILVRKGREGHLSQIIDAIEDIYEEIKGITQATVISATKLTEDTKQVIAQKLKNVPGMRDNIQIEEKIDPSIIGGFIIDLGDRRIDQSIASQLSSIKQQFSKN